MRKKKRIRTSQQKAESKCELAFKEAVKRRDKHCQICGDDYRLQVDHCFSRTVKKLYFDVQNLTLLCARCHFKKSYHQNGYEKMVDEIVRKREGECWWIRAVKIAASKTPHKMSIDRLEMLTKQYEGLYHEKEA